MIQSVATKYAIRAVCHLAACCDGHPVQAREIADTLGIPYHFLSKILQELARKGILSSTKGPGGGFRLVRPPEETTLYDLISVVEGPISDTECMLGLDVCSDEARCPMHDFWKSYRATFRQRMRSISLVDVVRAAEKKRQVAEALQLAE
jgi:Rrf2 family protein